MPKVRVIHGPNLNMLGQREPHLYGSTTLQQINDRLVARGSEMGIEVACYQSNSEGDIVTEIQICRGQVDAIIINPGALTHTSVAVRDALLACEVPAIECHLSNLHRREEFRLTNLTAAACVGQISGFGADSYFIALEAVARVIGR